MSDSLSQGAKALGFDLAPQTLERLQRYRDLMLAAAATFNLTAVRDPVAIERRHLIESLALARVLADRGLLPEGARVLDIGSGAGLPGLPLKIVGPDLAVDLLEAHGKRCRFLESVIATLGLEETVVLEGRAEAIGRDPARRETYDLALARAVAPLPVLIEYALPFLRVGGALATTKGSAAKSELARSGAALTALGGEIGAVLPFQAPEGPAQTLIIVRKAGETPSRFPRRVGVAAKRPLV